MPARLSNTLVQTELFWTFFQFTNSCSPYLSTVPTSLNLLVILCGPCVADSPQPVSFSKKLTRIHSEKNRVQQVSTDPQFQAELLKDQTPSCFTLKLVFLTSTIPVRHYTSCTRTQKPAKGAAGNVHAHSGRQDSILPSAGPSTTNELKNVYKRATSTNTTRLEVNYTLLGSHFCYVLFS